MNGRRESPGTYLVLLLIIAVVFWAEMVFFDKIPFYRDTLLQFYPWQSFADSVIKSGGMPLWNNFSGCGTPFIGNLQSAVFYPLKLFFIFLPFAAAVKLFILANILIAGSGMFFLVRDFKVKNSSAFFAALVFSFSGYLTSRVEFWSVLSASAWLPLIMLFIKRFIDSGRFKYFALSCLALAMPVFAGSAQIYFYNALILSAFVIWYSVTSQKTWWKAFGWFVGMTLLSLLLTAIQLIPFIEFVTHSVRQTGMDMGLASTWSLHPFKLVNFLTPYFWGNPAESAYYGSDQFWVGSFYCGVPVLVLVLVSLFFFFKQKKLLDRQVKQTIVFFFVLFLSFFVISLGRYGLVYGILYKILLPFRMIRYPAVAMYGAVFTLAVLSGLIVEKIAVNIKNKKMMIWAMGSAASLLAVTVLLYIYMNYFKTLTDPLRTAVTVKALVTSGALIISVAALFYLSAVKKAKPGVFILLLSALLIFDLLINMCGIIPLTWTKEVFERSEAEQYFKADSSDFRIATTPATYGRFGQIYENQRAARTGFPYKSYLKDVKNIMHDDYSMFCGVECFNVYDPMRLKRQDNAAFKISIQKTAFETCLMNIFNIKYLISYRGDLSEKGLVLRANPQGFFVYENKNVLPRAYVVYNILNSAGPADAFKKITAPEFLPLKYGVLEQPGISPFPENSLQAEEAGVIYPSANRVLINVKAEAKGLLVLSDSYYPGWEAEIDGVRSKIFVTNFMFRGVIVPAGKHTVEMVYRPLSFRAGVAVTLVTLLFLLLVSIWIWERKISR